MSGSIIMRPATVYLVLWTLGCGAGFLAALFVLRRRRALTPATSLAVALAWLFLFIGSKWHWRLEHLPWTEALLVSPAELFAPGRRLPLGLLTSGAAAALACVALQLPWRQVGDALAVFWSVLIPIGRIGCAIYGCCLGTVCSAWLRPLGWRYGAGTEPFHLQLGAGLIPPTSTLSLPVHPLPLYFALASIGTLALLVWLLHREAPAGMLLLTFCLLRPATKLALEPLRAEPAVAWLMIGIPAATLTGALTIALCLFVRRLRGARGRRLATATLLPLLLMAASPAAGSEATWTHALELYAQNPLRNRRLLRRLEREGHGDLPPVVLLALADARLRSGSFAAAERLFARVATSSPDEPYATWAILGRAWARLLASDTSLGHEASVHVVRAADDADAPPALGAAAQLTRAYARYWAGDDDAGAVAAFDAAVAAADGSLVDDARYGAARTRLRAGDRTGALAALRDLATWHSNGRPTAVSPALVALDRHAVLRAGFVRYRRSPLHTPASQLHVMLDGDGAALARAALRELGEHVPEPRALQAQPPALPRAAPPPRSRARLEPPARTAALAGVAAWLRPLLLVTALFAAGHLVHGWWDRGRHGTRLD